MGSAGYAPGEARRWPVGFSRVMLIADRKEIMGKFRISMRLKLTGWIATAFMAVTSGFFLYTSL